MTYKLLPLIVALASTPAVAADLTLALKNIEKPDGEIRIAIYDSEAGLTGNKPVHSLSLPAKSPTMQVKVPDLPAGEYGVMAFHDLNGNQTLDKNLLGIPKEPWAGSLRAAVMGPPGWSDVRFTLPAAGMTIDVAF